MMIGNAGDFFSGAKAALVAPIAPIVNMVAPPKKTVVQSPPTAAAITAGINNPANWSATPPAVTQPTPYAPAGYTTTTTVSGILGSSSSTVVSNGNGTVTKKEANSTGNGSGNCSGSLLNFSPGLDLSPSLNLSPTLSPVFDLSPQFILPFGTGSQDNGSGNTQATDYSGYILPVAVIGAVAILGMSYFNKEGNH